MHPMPPAHMTSLTFPDDHVTKQALAVKRGPRLAQNIRHNLSEWDLVSAPAQPLSANQQVVVPASQCQELLCLARSSLHWSHNIVWLAS